LFGAISDTVTTGWDFAIQATGIRNVSVKSSIIALFGGTITSPISTLSVASRRATIPIGVVSVIALLTHVKNIVAASGKNTSAGSALSNKTNYCAVRSVAIGRSKITSFSSISNAVSTIWSHAICSATIWSNVIIQGSVITLLAIGLLKLAVSTSQDAISANPVSCEGGGTSVTFFAKACINDSISASGCKAVDSASIVCGSIEATIVAFLSSGSDSITTVQSTGSAASSCRSVVGSIITLLTKNRILESISTSSARAVGSASSAIAQVESCSIVTLFVPVNHIVSTRGKNASGSAGIRDNIAVGGTVVAHFSNACCSFQQTISAVQGALSRTGSGSYLGIVAFLAGIQVTVTTEGKAAIWFAAVGGSGVHSSIITFLSTINNTIATRRQFSISSASIRFRIAVENTIITLFLRIDNAVSKFATWLREVKRELIHQFGF